MAGWLWSGTTWQQELLRSERELLESAPWVASKFTVSDVVIPHGHVHIVKATADPEPDASGAPLLLLHGFGQGAASWWRNLPGLARGHAHQVSRMSILRRSDSSDPLLKCRGLSFQWTGWALVFPLGR